MAHKFRAGTRLELLVLAVVAAAPVTGCSYSIKEIDVSKAEPVCARECTETYSACISGGNQVGFKTETLRACREAYAACVQTCPTK